MSVGTDDLRIGSITELMEPQALIEEMPPSAAAVATVSKARQAIHSILCGDDDRLVTVVGPCSIQTRTPRLNTLGFARNRRCIGG